RRLNSTWEKCSAAEPVWIGSSIALLPHQNQLARLGIAVDRTHRLVAAARLAKAFGHVGYLGALNDLLPATLALHLGQYVGAGGKGSDQAAGEHQHDVQQVGEGAKGFFLGFVKATVEQAASGHSGLRLVIVGCVWSWCVLLNLVDHPVVPLAAQAP